MEQYFPIKLTNSPLAFVLAVPAVVSLLGGFGTAFYSSQRIFEQAAILTAAVVSAIVGYRVLRWLVTREVVVAVSPEQVAVHDGKTHKAVSILFGQVRSYRFESLRDREELVFKLHNGSTQKLSANKLFGRIGDFAAMRQTVESNMAAYQVRHNGRLLREKNFFEKPAATVLLLVATLIFGWAIVQAMSVNRPVSGSLFSMAGVYISYVVPWLLAAERRRQQEQ